jgi:hypothetical protein
LNKLLTVVTISQTNFGPRTASHLTVQGNNLYSITTADSFLSLLTLFLKAQWYLLRMFLQQLIILTKSAFDSSLGLKLHYYVPSVTLLILSLVPFVK